MDLKSWMNGYFSQMAGTNKQAKSTLITDHIENKKYGERGNLIFAVELGGLPY